MSLQLPIPPEIFHVASLNRFLDIVGTTSARHVAAESAEIGQKRWQDWEAIKKTLCLEEEKVLVTLGAQSKALLLWMHGGVTGRLTIHFQASSPNSTSNLLLSPNLRVESMKCQTDARIK